MSKSSVTLADYIASQLALCGKTQSEVCLEIGYVNPNLLTMIKKGRTKLPINKVKIFAKALGVDPVFLLKLAMKEYQPDTWDVIEEIMGSDAVTDNEYEIVNLVREASGGMSLTPSNDEEKRELQELVSKWKKRVEIESLVRPDMRTKVF